MTSYKRKNTFEEAYLCAYGRILIFFVCVSLLFLFCGAGAGTEASCIQYKYSTTELLQCGDTFKPVFWEKKNGLQGGGEKKSGVSVVGQGRSA